MIFKLGYHLFQASSKLAHGLVAKAHRPQKAPKDRFYGCGLNKDDTLNLPNQKLEVDRTFLGLQELA
jgi:hypothetical protein